MVLCDHCRGSASLVEGGPEHRLLPDGVQGSNVSPGSRFPAASPSLLAFGGFLSALLAYAPQRLHLLLPTTLLLGNGFGELEDGIHAGPVTFAANDALAFSRHGRVGRQRGYAPYAGVPVDIRLWVVRNILNFDGGNGRMAGSAGR